MSTIGRHWLSYGNWYFYIIIIVSLQQIKSDLLLDKDEEAYVTRKKAEDKYNFNGRKNYEKKYTNYVKEIKWHLKIEMHKYCGRFLEISDDVVLISFSSKSIALINKD